MQTLRLQHPWLLYGYTAPFQKTTRIPIFTFKTKNQLGPIVLLTYSLRATRGQGRKYKFSFLNPNHYYMKKYAANWERKNMWKLTILEENLRIYFTNQNSLISEI